MKTGIQVCGLQLKYTVTDKKTLSVSGLSRAPIAQRITIPKLGRSGEMPDSNMEFCVNVDDVFQENRQYFPM